MSNKKYGRKEIRSTTSFERRLFTSWGICFAIGILIGCLIITGINYFKKETYGTLDGRVFTEEISMDWASGAELGFVALDVPLDEEVQEFIYCLSYGYNIEFPFVMGLIDTESKFQPESISKSNDYGLMQINKVNHGWLSETLGVTNFTDPYENTRSGLFILRKLFEKYEEPAKVLMAYNMGESGASKLWKQGIFETEYTRKVMGKVAEYEQQIAEKKG